MFLISMKTKLSLVLRSSHINPIQIKKKRGDKKLVQVNYCISWYVILRSKKCTLNKTSLDRQAARLVKMASTWGWCLNENNQATYLVIYCIF